MEIIERINAKLKSVLGNEDRSTSVVLRSLLAEIRNKEIELRGKGREITDEDVLSVIKKEAKKRRDAIELYRKGGRDDLADKEETELKMLEEFLPEQMTDEELEKIIGSILIKLEDKISFGEAMKWIMKEVGGRAEGSRVSSILNKKLNSKS